MPPAPPLYTADRCTPAYQLDWSVSLFWRVAPDTSDWLTLLKEATEPDGIRILQHRFPKPKLSLFLASTKPNVAASTLVARIKGRLQHLVRERIPQAFQRNFAVRGVGSTKRDKLDKYHASQLAHHPMADQRVAERFAQYQIHNPEVS